MNPMDCSEVRMSPLVRDKHKLPSDPGLCQLGTSSSRRLPSGPSGLLNAAVPLDGDSASDKWDYVALAETVTTDGAMTYSTDR